MPLDPKYSGLPYIADDTQDTYESADLPEADQHASSQQQEELPSKSDIEHSSINHNNAFQKFKNTQLSADDVDFTDRIYPTKKIGYSVDQRKYEILDEDSRSQETPIQRFQRLQAELRSLVEDVDQLKTSAASTGDNIVTPEQLASLVEGLQQQVSSMNLESVLGPNSHQFEVFDPQNSLEKKLHTEIDKLKKQSVKTESAKGAGIAYEVYGAQDQGKEQGAHYTDLEKRLARLESVIGTSHLKSSILSGEVSGKPLSEAVQKLTTRVSLLDPANLDNVESRLSALNHRLQQLTTEKKEVLSDTDTQNRVAELYQLVKKWDGLMDNVPQIVSRLEALKVLHEQALQFSGALNFLDESQKASAGQIASTQKLLHNLEQRLSADLESVLKNTAAVQSKSHS